MGKSTINGPFSIAMLVHQRVKRAGFSTPICSPRDRTSKPRVETLRYAYFDQEVSLASSNSKRHRAVPVDGGSIRLGLGKYLDKYPISNN